MYKFGVAQQERRRKTGYKRVTKHEKKAGPPVCTDGPAEIPEKNPLTP